MLYWPPDPKFDNPNAHNPLTNFAPKPRRAYGFALDEFFGWYRAADRGPFRKALVQEYRTHLEKESLSSSTINVRLAAIRKLAQEAGDNGMLASEIAAGIAKVKGLRGAACGLGTGSNKEMPGNYCGHLPGRGRKPSAIALCSGSSSAARSAVRSWFGSRSKMSSSAPAAGSCRT